eukprot:CAMPEP_0185311884 /NCGR_PEP_ID=MMETSP1363-20130426/29045_1 /TAXON_ID=38817 /ORGANISM="Gephyrocapsa oceanica, Strain RCC1303" /LENGTH=112 /DNA_ID=CAMNT_0027909623 /DNA_START=195 /DNA_END=534 /DNA_ORIENTATION=+
MCAIIQPERAQQQALEPDVLHDDGPRLEHLDVRLQHGQQCLQFPGAVDVDKDDVELVNRANRRECHRIERPKLQLWKSLSRHCNHCMAAVDADDTLASRPCDFLGCNATAAA